LPDLKCSAGNKNGKNHFVRQHRGDTPKEVMRDTRLINQTSSPTH